jgi:isocitrate/isopropylmalate dehydrogenase
MTDAHRICGIPGDGVGTEVIPQALRVVPADLEDTRSTSEMGDAVLERIAARAA